MNPIKLVVKTRTEKYPIIIGKNLILKMPKILKKNSINFSKCLVVIDKNVPRKFIIQIKNSLKKKLQITFIEASEKNKNQKTIDSILDILLKKDFTREDCLIAMGGGITGDLVGFAASQFKRGLKFINIPTTLLAQVDSSIGGKTGINTSYGKNLVGSFYQPRLVLSDSNFLLSLTKRELVCGYAEILKHSIISNKNFYLYLINNISKIMDLKFPFIEKAIFESCKIKKKVVEKDEKENDFRQILNFGHTFAHGFEAALNYSKILNHGEAVLLGMCTALKFSYNLKMLNEKDFESISSHIRKSKFPNDINNYLKKKI